MFKAYLQYGRYVMSMMANVGVLGVCCCSS
jgi:hypothetical protein